MYKDKKISLVIPCFNEEAGLDVLLPTKPDFIDEVIIVDNASTDRTAQVAQKYGARVVYEARKGYGYAYLAGLPQAAGEIILCCDGDNTYPLLEFKKLLDKMLLEGCAFVTASRFPLKNQSAMPRINQISNSLSVWFFRKILKVPFSDMQTGMWAFHREILPRILPTGAGMNFSQEIKINALFSPGIKCGEVHIDYLPRIGESKYRRLHDGFQTCVQTVSLIRSIQNARFKIKN